MKIISYLRKPRNFLEVVCVLIMAGAGIVGYARTGNIGFAFMSLVAGVAAGGLQKEYKIYIPTDDKS